MMNTAMMEIQMMLKDVGIIVEHVLLVMQKSIKVLSDPSCLMIKCAIEQHVLELLMEF